MGIEVIADIVLNRVDDIRESEQEKSRPLIVVSHSLGGIVVKKVRGPDLQMLR